MRSRSRRRRGFPGDAADCVDLLPGYDGPLTQVAEQPLHRALGLTDGELDRICELLERDPNHFELAVFSLLWSEHCGYKHSAPLLRRLPSHGDRVLQGPGENAGVIDLRDGAGIDVHLDRVPLREADLEPWEVMISESQERMVAVVRPEMLDAVQRICSDWELACTLIGDVTDTGELRAFSDGELVGEIPARL